MTFEKYKKSKKEMKWKTMNYSFDALGGKIHEFYMALRSCTKSLVRF